MFNLVRAFGLSLIFSFAMGCSHYGSHKGHNCDGSHCSAEKKEACKEHGDCKCKEGSCHMKDEKK